MACRPEGSRQKASAPQLNHPAFRDEKGTSRVVLGMNKGMPTLVFADPTGRSRIALGASDNGTLTLGFRGAGEKILRATLGVGADGAAAFALHDTNGKPRVGLEVGADGASDVVVMNKDGKVIWKAP